MIWIDLVISILIVVIGFMILFKGVDKHNELIKKDKNKAENVYLLHATIASAIMTFGTVKLAEILRILI